MPAQPGDTSIAHARNLVQSVADSPAQSATLLGLLACTALVSPVAAAAAAVAGLTFLLARPRPVRAPLGMQDAVAGPGAKSYPIGTEVGGGLLSLTREAARGHMLFVGGPGTPRSDAMLGALEGALADGSGFMMCEAKADISLLARVHGLVGKHGRNDDLLVLNLMGKSWPTNTFNPFADVSSDTSAAMIMAMVDRAGYDSMTWLGRATSMLHGVMRALVSLRDDKGLVIHPGVIRRHMTFAAIHDLASPLRKAGALPEDVRVCVTSYLTCLPGFDPGRGARQASGVLEQHAYLVEPIDRALAVLTEDYGHVFQSGSPDICIGDLIHNRRILVVLLPPTTGPSDRYAPLGRLVAALVRESVTGLRKVSSGDGGDGRSQPVFMCALDDIDRYAVEDLGARMGESGELGLSMIYGTGDLESLRSDTLKAGQGIISGSGTHVFLRRDTHGRGSVLATALGEAAMRDHIGDDPSTPGSPGDPGPVIHLPGGDMTVVHGGEAIPARCLSPVASARGMRGGSSVMPNSLVALEPQSRVR